MKCRERKRWRERCQHQVSTQCQHCAGTGGTYGRTDGRNDQPTRVLEFHMLYGTKNESLRPPSPPTNHHPPFLVLVEAKAQKCSRAPSGWRDRKHSLLTWRRRRRRRISLVVLQIVVSQTGNWLWLIEKIEKTASPSSHTSTSFLLNAIKPHHWGPRQSPNIQSADPVCYKLWWTWKFLKSTK